MSGRFACGFHIDSHFADVTGSSDATMNWEVPLLGACAYLVTDAHGLGTLPEALPHFIIFPLSCQPTLLLPNPHDFCCPLADSNNGILGPEVDF